MHLHNSVKAFRILQVLFFSCIVTFVSCSDTSYNIDLSFIKREIPWGSSYESIQDKLADEIELTYSRHEKSAHGSSYLFLGGSFKGIKTNCWKFNYVGDALESIYIWIVNSSAARNDQTFTLLKNYFNKIAFYESRKDIGVWIYGESYFGKPKLLDTNIILEKRNDVILIKIIHSIEALELL